MTQRYTTQLTTNRSNGISSNITNNKTTFKGDDKSSSSRAEAQAPVLEAANSWSQPADTARCEPSCMRKFKGAQVGGQLMTLHQHGSHTRCSQLQYTGFSIEELKVALDAGAQGIPNLQYIFVTHGHLGECKW